MNLINNENVDEVIEGTEGEIRGLLSEGLLSQADVRTLEICGALLEINKYLLSEVERLKRNIKIGPED